MKGGAGGLGGGGGGQPLEGDVEEDDPRDFFPWFHYSLGQAKCLLSVCYF